MDENIQIFQAVVENNFSAIYIDSLEEYTALDIKGALEKVINSSMQNPENYSLALRLLNSARGELVEKNSCLWASLLLNLYVSCKEVRLAHKIIITLGELAKLSNTSEESKKLFGSNHVTNMLNIITKEYFVPKDNISVLHCMIVLLKLYPEYSIHASVNVKNFLSKFTDSPYYDTVEYSAKCYHLLLNASKHQLHYTQMKELWRIYEQKLVEGLHTLLNMFFGRLSHNVMEAVNCEPLHISMLPLSDDPIKRLPQIFIRFKNLAIHLIVTIREPFLAEKLINPKKILNLIKSALDISHLMSRTNKTINDKMLGVLLPQLYYILLQILETTILTLGKNLRRYYNQIWMILGDLKRLSTFKALTEEKKSYMRLLVKVSNAISLWCKHVNQGSRSDLTNNFLMTDILDIPSIHTTFSKNTYGKCIPPTDVRDQIIRDLIDATQRCIYEIINSAPNNLHFNSALKIEAKVINVFGLICDTSLGTRHNYEHRCDLIKLLFVLFTTKTYLKPSSAEVLINIIRESYLTVETIEARHTCGIIILYLENCIHPQKNGFESSVAFEKFLKLKSSYSSRDNSQGWTDGISMLEIMQPAIHSGTEAHNCQLSIPQTEDLLNISCTDLLPSIGLTNDTNSSADCAVTLSEKVSASNLCDELSVANIITTFIDDLQ